MKNILIACISLINEDFNLDRDGNVRNPIPYTGSDGITVEAMQTNEACIKFVIKKLAQSNKQLDNYFRVMSLAVAEQKDNFTMRYLNGAVNRFCNPKNRNAESFHIPTYNNFILDPNEEKNHVYDAVLNSIAEKILNIAKDDSDINIYLDVAGGKRINFIFIQLLTKLLSFYGYGVHAYYADVDGTIVDMKLSFEHMKILDAVNEFVRRGSAESLRACFGETDARTVNSLLLAMEDFENSIQLCDINLSDKLARVSENLRGMENVGGSGSGLFVIRTMIPLIREKFHISEDNSELGELGIVRWCLENGLIQQALTIFNETVKNIIINDRIITIDENAYNRIIEHMMEGKHESKRNNIKVVLIMRSVFEEMYNAGTINNDVLRMLINRFRQNNPVRETSRDGYFKYRGIESHIGAAFFCRDYLPYGIRVSIDFELCRKILMDCNFVSLVRNRVNHAADSSVYDESVINLYRRGDYRFKTFENVDANGLNIVPKNIKTDMYRALENLEAALNSIGRGRSK